MSFKILFFSFIVFTSSFCFSCPKMFDIDQTLPDRTLFIRQFIDTVYSSNRNKKNFTNKYPLEKVKKTVNKIVRNHSKNNTSHEIQRLIEFLEANLGSNKSSLYIFEILMESEAIHKPTQENRITLAIEHMNIIKEFFDTHNDIENNSSPQFISLIEKDFIDFFKFGYFKYIPTKSYDQDFVSPENTQKTLELLRKFLTKEHIKQQKGLSKIKFSNLFSIFIFHNAEVLKNTIEFLEANFDYKDTGEILEARLPLFELDKFSFLNDIIKEENLSTEGLLSYLKNPKYSNSSINIQNL